MTDAAEETQYELDVGEGEETEIELPDSAENQQEEDSEKTTDPKPGKRVLKNVVFAMQHNRRCQCGDGCSCDLLSGLLFILLTNSTERSDITNYILPARIVTF